MKDTIANIIEWAEDKGIYEKSTAIAQLNGAIGELYEFREAVIKEKPVIERKTELGDVLVFLINYMYLDGSPLYSILGALSYQIEFTTEGDLERNIIKTADQLINCRIGSACSILCRFYDIEECLQLAYKKIIKRTGKMINGKFVKDYEPWNGA